jgi:predicted NUDIX family NTP pyrophosphohydrolase
MRPVSGATERGVRTGDPSRERRDPPHRYGPGGPKCCWRIPEGCIINRNIGHWTILKGESFVRTISSRPRCASSTKTGSPSPHVTTDAKSPPIPLGTVTQASGKVVHAWAINGDLDPAASTSNTFEMNWPPGSTRLEVFPEIDRVAWFGLVEASRRANRSQAAFIERLAAALPDTRVREPR